MSPVIREASQKLVKKKKKKKSKSLEIEPQQLEAGEFQTSQTSQNNAQEETAQQNTNIESTPSKALPDAPQSYDNFRNHYRSKKKTFTRISVDPNRQYSTPESREAWGPNVKGKKFRKEKSKKKRCQGTGGMRIDGSVKSIRLDA